MTDKQIIIDGVDVSECEFCDWKGSNFPQCRIRSASFKSFCEGYKCYYKQLQREKQNSQEARDTAIKEFNRAEELKTLLKRKEQECEKLKRQYKELGQCSKRLKDYYDKEKETRSNRFLKLKQTLTEIKEIADENIRIADLEGLNGVYRRGLAKQIIQKCEEVDK